MLQWTLTRRGGTLLAKCRRHVMAVERRLMAGFGAKAQAGAALVVQNCRRSAAGWLEPVRKRAHAPLDCPDETA